MKKNILESKVPHFPETATGIGETAEAMFQFLLTKPIKRSLYISLSVILVIVVPLYLSLKFTAPGPKEISSSRPEETPMATNTFGVKVEKNPTQSKLTELGVTTWPKYVSLPLLSHIFCF